MVVSNCNASVCAKIEHNGYEFNIIISKTSKFDIFNDITSEFIKHECDGHK